MIEILEKLPAQAPVAPPEDPKVLLKTPSALAQWLDSLPEQAVCGQARHTGLCPLAQYLRACYPQGGLVLVGRDVYHVGSAGGSTLPSWAVRFVRWVDGHARHQEITAGAARAALESLR